MPGFRITTQTTAICTPLKGSQITIIVAGNGFGWPQNYAPAYTRSHAYYGEATYYFGLGCEPLDEWGVSQTGCAKRPAS
jgi:hypothetical protein